MNIIKLTIKNIVNIKNFFIFFVIKTSWLKKIINIDNKYGKKTIIIDIERDNIKDNKNQFLLFGSSKHLTELIIIKKVKGN